MDNELTVKYDSEFAALAGERTSCRGKKLRAA
jgi:hypothetical protein